MIQISTPHSSQPTLPRTWHAGSLTYTGSTLAAVIFWLLLGGFAWVFKDRCTPSIAQLLLSDFGASDNFSSILIGSLPWGLALFVLPILGHYSDRYRSRYGRRIPFLSKAIPIVAISMPGLTLSPWLGSLFDHALGSFSPGLNASVLVFLAVFWGLFQFADILGNLLIGALVNDMVPQRVIGRFFGGYRAVGLVAGMLFNFYLFDGADTISVAIFGGIGFLSVIAFSLMCMKVREGEYPLPETDNAPGVLRATLKYFKECFGSSFYRLAFVAFTLCTTAWTPVNLYSTLFSREIIAADLYGRLLTLTFGISLVLAYPLGMLADRFHPLRVGIVAMALYALVTLWGDLYAQSPTTFNVAFVLHGVMAGTCVTATASIMQRLLPRMKFAQFASAAGIVACLCNILIGPVTGYILGDSHPVYRHLFLISSAMGWAGVVAMILLYRAYLAHGGDNAYVASGDGILPTEAAG